MTWRALSPWVSLASAPTSLRRAPVRLEGGPFWKVHEEMDRLLSDFLGSRESGNTEGGFTPSLHLQEDDKALTASFELPGIDLKEINISIDREHLVVEGERRLEKSDTSDDKASGVKVYSEFRSIGRFSRMIPLSCEVDEDKIDASMKNGILTIVLPKVVSKNGGKKTISVREG